MYCISVALALSCLSVRSSQLSLLGVHLYPPLHQLNLKVRLNSEKTLSLFYCFTLTIISLFLILDAIVKHGVTTMAITPSALATLNREHCTSLKTIQVAGEACPSKLANEWARYVDFFIGLGPTELTGHACCGKFQVGDMINIGMPVSNAAVYILNEAGQIQPPGVIGELCIAGANVSQGYLNRDELTKERFVDNPFDSAKPNMFKIGDLARRLPDGRIQFIGRPDSQIKIRGYRIEVQEIQAAMIATGLVSQAHVTPITKENRECFLLGYVTPKLNKEKQKTLLTALELQLPSYMIPKTIFSLNEFPLNKNGKLDVKALPHESLDLEQEETDQVGTIAEDDPITKLVLLIFASELDVGKESWNNKQQLSSFFELGGTSLAAVRSVRQIGEAFRIELRVTDIIQSSTIKEFICLVQKRVEESKELRPANAEDINVSATGIKTVQSGREMMPVFTFRLLNAFAMIIHLIVSLVIPISIGVTAFLAVLDGVGFPTILPLLPGLYAIVAFSNLVTTSLVTRIIAINILGKKSSSYPIRSVEFVCWCYSRRAVAITTQMFWFASSSKLMVFMYKMLGAKIANNVMLDNCVVDIPSLLSIGDGCSLGYMTRLVCGEIRGDTLFIAPTVLESRVKTEPRCSITPGAYLPSNCVVKAWASVTSTLLPKEDGIAREIIGSPVVYGEVINNPCAHFPSSMMSNGYLFVQVLAMYVLSMFTFVGVGASCVVGINLVDGGVAQLLYFVIAGLPVAFSILLVVIIVTKRVVLNRASQDVVHNGKLFYLRVWFIDTILLSPLLSLALDYLLPPSLHHCFLRAMGGSAGKHTFWNSPILRAGCESITIGETLHSGFMQIWNTQCLSGDGIMFKPIDIGDDCTIGQRTVVMVRVLCNVML